MKIETSASASGNDVRQDDPMDVGAVMMKGKGKGQGKFKGKGKGYKGGSKGKGNRGGNQEKERTTTMERVNSRSRQMRVGIVVRVDIIKRIVGQRMVSMVKAVKVVRTKEGQRMVRV